MIEVKKRTISAAARGPVARRCPDGQEQSFCAEEVCLAWSGGPAGWVVSSCPPSCSALDPGAGICELHVSSVSRSPVGRSGGGCSREPERQRKPCSFLLAPLLCLRHLVIALHPGLSTGSWPPAFGGSSNFGGTPSISLTAAPPQRPGFSSGTLFLRASGS